MGCGKSAHADDIREYESLCRKYGEKPFTPGWGQDPDPHSAHANELYRRYHKDSKASKNEAIEAREMWDAFEEAYLQCPQKNPFSDDQLCLGYGTVAEMKKSKKKCLKFWMDPESVGGSTLWDTGYASKLEYHFAKRVKSYQEKIKKAKMEIKF